MACLPAAVSLLLLEGLFMQISGVSLALTWPCRLCLLKSSPVCEPLLQAFPFPVYWGGDTAPAFSGLCVYLQFMWEVVFPLSCGVFLPPLLSQAFPLLVAGCMPLLLPSLAGLFIYSSGRDFPSPLFGAQGAPPSLLRVFFFCYCLLFSFSFFPGWGSICAGGYADLAQGCLWEYRVPLSSPCGRRLPKLSGCWCLAVAWEPSWFLHLMWSGDTMVSLGVWRSQSFASSRWFFL
jgi:hypothetical protein